MRYVFVWLFFVCFSSCCSTAEPDKKIDGGRFFTFNTVVRVNQIEVSRDSSVREDEKGRHTLKNVQAFRKAVYDGWPETQCPNVGEFGLQWRSQFRNNDSLDYQFKQQGTGIGV